MTPAEATATATALCSKCSEPLDTEGSPKWCKKCRAEYQRNYQQTKAGKDEARGFHMGVRATKECLANEFDRLGSGGFDGEEAAFLIRQAPGPRYEPAIPTD